MKAALITLALLATPAAAVPVLTSDTNSIVVGQSITFSVLIPFTDVPPFDVAQYGGGYDDYFSGDGQTQSVSGVSIVGSGPVTFTYLNAGDYVASAFVFRGYHPPGLLGFGSPGTQSLLVYEKITVLASVPEPATWALLLFGFAFFAIKGIWPAWKRK